MLKHSVGNYRVTQDIMCDTWPTVMIISWNSDSTIDHNICLTEEYKMHTLHIFKNLVGLIDVAKAEVGQEIRLGSGWFISLSRRQLLLQTINFHSHCSHSCHKCHHEESWSSDASESNLVNLTNTVSIFCPIPTESMDGPFNCLVVHQVWLRTPGWEPQGSRGFKYTKGKIETQQLNLALPQSTQMNLNEGIKSFKHIKKKCAFLCHKVKEKLWIRISFKLIPFSRSNIHTLYSSGSEWHLIAKDSSCTENLAYTGAKTRTVQSDWTYTCCSFSLYIETSKTTKLPSGKEMPSPSSLCFSL